LNIVHSTGRHLQIATASMDAKERGVGSACWTTVSRS
jgi:hypothetical protein